MGYYGRAKLALNAFNSFTSKIFTGAAKHSSRGPGNTGQTVNSCSQFSEFRSFGGILSRKKFGNGFSSHLFSPPKTNRFSTSRSCDGRRFYYIDRYNVQHFRPRGPDKWFQNPRVVIAVVLVSSGIVITVYVGNLETVPYTKRTHFVLLSKNVERQIGEAQFEQIKKSYKGKLLPAIHPESVRVRMIAKDIIDALKRGIKHQQGWSDLEYGTESWGMPSTTHGGTQSVAAALSEEGKLETQWSRADEILDDDWVQKSRKKGQERGSQPMTQHLDGLNWEVLVVNEPVVNAFCLPGGKIVVFTGLLDHFRSDVEVATILGHEIGHCIARHAAEGITKNMWFAIIQLVLLQFVTMPDLVNAMSYLLLRLPFSRRLFFILASSQGDALGNVGALSGKN
ncbi:mitochondrial metalloendopeptidase OMA1 isoform X2 [Aristolochia californica]|uniref:mitochondrial metalloendopeptidase OMA1 isoform X2 n=1 Tax=Aristolochia californica TaxID=171875 RepID=UPI0035DDD5CA